VTKGHLRTTSDHRSESQQGQVIVDTESKNRKIDDLATIVEKVEQKAHVPADNPDLVALRHIVENKISALKTEGSNSEPRTNRGIRFNERSKL
jgi:hypothetical protein